MSAFTDRAHENALSDTLYWIEKKPESCADYLEYGLYLLRNREYCRASWWMWKAIKCDDKLTNGILAKYYLSYMLFYKMDCYSYDFDINTLTFDFIKEAENFIIKTPECDTRIYYGLGMCYRYGIGVSKNIQSAHMYFNHNVSLRYDENIREELSGVPASIYEMGKLYEKGLGVVSKDREIAIEYYRMAYDMYYDEAIFSLFGLYDEDYNKFPYKREIKEAYSFKLGQFMRVARVYNRKYAYEKLIEIYSHGYPGDSGKADERFKKKADKYRVIITQNNEL